MKKRLLLFLILGFIFFPQSVFAKSVVTDTPETFSTLDANVPANYITVPIQNYTLVSKDNHLYGNQFMAAASVIRPLVSFNFDENSSLNGGVFDVNFYLYSTSKAIFDDPFRVWIKDSENQVGSCYVNNASHTPFELFGDGLHYPSDFSNTIQQSVTCSNVPINGSFRIFVSQFQTNQTDILAIGPVTFVKDDDLKGAIEDNTSEVKKNTEETKKQTEAIKDSNTTEAGSSANGFFKDFSSDDYGLTDVITAPLNFIKSLSSTSCTNLKLKVPFLPGDNHIELPCMTSIYNQYFGDLFTIYQALTFGMISYWVCVDILRLVNNFKNPDNDEVEVADL